MGSDITKPVKRLVRSVKKRGIGIGVAVGGGSGNGKSAARHEPLVPPPMIGVQVNAAPPPATITPIVNAPRAQKEITAALNRRRTVISKVTPSAFPVYRWSLDANHHVLSFDNKQSPGTGWKLNPATPIGRAYKEPGPRPTTRIAIHRWASKNDSNLFFYGPSADQEEAALKRQRLAYHLTELHALNVMYAARNSRFRVNVHPTGHCLGTIPMLRP